MLATSSCKQNCFTNKKNSLNIISFFSKNHPIKLRSVNIPEFLECIECIPCDKVLIWYYICKYITINGRHLGTAQCKKGAERKRRRLAETETMENLERAFHAYGKPMEAVSEFRYLGRLLMATEDDWPAVTGNIRKAWVSWGRLARVLGREEADPKVSRSFYNAATQQVLLFGAETWFLTRKMESALDAIQGRVERRLPGRQPLRDRDGGWFYLSLAGAMKEAGMVRIRTSILRRQNTVAQFIATRPILGLCEVAARRPGTRVPRR